MRFLHRILFIALPALLVLFAECSRNAETGMPREIYEEIKSTNKMVFASMSITKTVKSERDDWYKIGKRIAVYSYNTYLRAYINLADLQEDDVEVNEKDKTVHILLPPVRVELDGRDVEMHKEYENIGLLRTELDSRERAVMKEEANTSLKRELARNPKYKKELTEAAESKARSFFQNLLKNKGYSVTVDFR